MMNKIPSYLTTFLLGGITGVLISFIVPHPRNDLTRREVEEAYATNLQTRQHMALVFTALEANTDVLMRLAHYTRPHTEHTIMCPECYGASDTRMPDIQLAVIGNAPATPGIWRDADDIAVGMGGIYNSLRGMHFTLTHNLHRLRTEGTAPGSPLTYTPNPDSLEFDHSGADELLELYSAPQDQH